MRIDVVSIFPEYLEPLRLSLLGRARSEGLLTLQTHDLRAWTHDRHRTVDDTPYGGGPGMVMLAEPWGAAIDSLLAADATAGVTPTLVMPTPAGVPFTHRLAEHFATRPWLVIACGRYEGIDQRVLDHFSTRLETVEVSIGDFVLNGGEAAALVMVESVARLLPGFVGNPDSLLEESHRTGDHGPLLEYPVYSRPVSWRGLDVPDVLLSGDHGRVARWRHEQSVRRTAQRRPDLAHPTQTLTVATLDRAEVRPARPADAGELLTLQRCCWVDEAQVNEALHIAPLDESLADVRAGIEEWLTFVVRFEGRLVSSGRCRAAGEGTWEVGRLMVVPDLTGRGIGRWMLEYVEAAAPAGTTSYRLFTGARSDRNLRMYRRAGYRVSREPGPAPGTVVLVKDA